MPASPALCDAVVGLGGLLCTTLDVVDHRLSFKGSMAWMRWLLELRNVVAASAVMLRQPGATMAAALQRLAHIGEEFGRTWHGLLVNPRDWTPPVPAQPLSSKLLSTMVEAVMTVVKLAWRSQEAQPHATWAKKMELENLDTFTWTTVRILRPVESAPSEPQVAVLLLRLALAVHRTTLLVGTEAPIQARRGGPKEKPSAEDLAAAFCPQLRWSCSISIERVDDAARTVYTALRSMVAAPQSAAPADVAASDAAAAPPDTPSNVTVATGVAPMVVAEDIPTAHTAVSAIDDVLANTAATLEPTATASAATITDAAAPVGEPVSHGLLTASPAAASIGCAVAELKDLLHPGAATDAAPMDVSDANAATDALSSTPDNVVPADVGSVEPQTAATVTTPADCDASVATLDPVSPQPATLKAMPARGFDAVHALVLMSFSTVADGPEEQGPDGGLQQVRTVSCTLATIACALMCVCLCARH